MGLKKKKTFAHILSYVLNLSFLCVLVELNIIADDDNNHNTIIGFLIPKIIIIGFLIPKIIIKIIGHCVRVMFLEHC